MEVNEEKRQKFMEYAAKRVNNVMHDISILEPMARSNAYDFTRNDVDEMFNAIQNSLDSVREEYYRKFEAKAKTTKQAFSFGQAKSEVVLSNESADLTVVNESSIDVASSDELLDEATTPSVTL